MRFAHGTAGVLLGATCGPTDHLGHVVFEARRADAVMRLVNGSVRVQDGVETAGSLPTSVLGIEIANEVHKSGTRLDSIIYRGAHLLPSRRKFCLCVASSSLIFSRSRSVTSRRNREFSSSSSAIRSPPPRVRSGWLASRVRHRCKVMTLTPSVRAISLCNLPCVAKSFACASFVEISILECLFFVAVAACLRRPMLILPYGCNFIAPYYKQRVLSRILTPILQATRSFAGSGTQGRQFQKAEQMDWQIAEKKTRRWQPFAVL
jgi:hypothetical protein